VFLKERERENKRESEREREREEGFLVKSTPLLLPQL